MNTEEIKLIIDLFAALSITGKDAFIWWLIIKYALHYTLTFFGVLTVAVIIAKIIRGFSEADTNLKAIRDLLGVGSGGWYSPSDQRSTMKKIGELLEGAKK